MDSRARSNAVATSSSLPTSSSNSSPGIGLSYRPSFTLSLTIRRTDSFRRARIAGSSAINLFVPLVKDRSVATMLISIDARSRANLVASSVERAVRWNSVR
ncbi:hypothetical protein F442_15062 [Phytophthora nicotianae P10297]|uniref:Uncharacterized protein n=2 Tax=Phytophthora nicotianae TaxID=4792 RepID=W2PUL4_PHYN3|nr:hypothetical protein PPTG_23742 [Phytophthora nicotianae INRA-310]ETN03730.1 hypothetical protein PPTG_23742 [Phytophthora nicotianae INRA-310]ETP37107.1 hypothetical protein F442_15062 [Phytophthora nicotianae P10297]